MEKPNKQFGFYLNNLEINKHPLKLQPYLKKQPLIILTMPFQHKFQKHKFKNGFETHNSILDTVPYHPEVIFIGTYNHGWSWNTSDFFYGRGMYMWTILGNIFLNNRNKWTRQRTINNDVPSHDQIFKICIKGKLIFADIVKGIKENIPAIELDNEKCVLVNGEYRWESKLISNQKTGEYSDAHLDNLGSKNFLDDNVTEIVKYINATKSIKHVYFTFKSGNWIAEKLSEIKRKTRKDIKVCSLFSPTGNGFRKNLEEPFNDRAWGLTHCWIWNGLDHQSPINRPNYGHLDHQWLISTGVDPNNF